jgi:glutathione S-transferase
MAEIEVWGIGTSRTMRAHWMLAELDIAYRCHPIRTRTGEANTDAYRQLNPREKIPTLRHGGLVLTESAAIALYLSESFPPPDDFYVPPDTVGRARLNEWCFFVMAELDAHSLYLIRRHDGLQHIYGPAPEAVRSAEDSFLKQMTAMAPRVDANGPYLLGAGCSVADILMATCLDWAAGYGIGLPEAWRGYRDRVAARPAYNRARAANHPD